jgi:DNA-binding NarL/FixJ family response regulator
VLSGHQDAHQIDAAFDAGATGYLLKTDLPGRLASAIDEMLDKGVPMSARVSAVVLERARRNSGSLPPLEFEQQAAVHAQPPVKLSRREREVVTLLVAGHRYDGIAAELGISVNTVRSHIRTLYEKLGAQTKVDAVMAAVRMGIVEDVPPRG